MGSGSVAALTVRVASAGRAGAFRQAAARSAAVSPQSRGGPTGSCFCCFSWRRALVVVQVRALAVAPVAEPHLGGGGAGLEGEAVGVERGGPGGDDLDCQDGLDRIGGVEGGDRVEGGLDFVAPGGLGLVVAGARESEGPGRAGGGSGWGPGAGWAGGWGRGAGAGRAAEWASVWVPVKVDILTNMTWMGRYV